MAKAPAIRLHLLEGPAAGGVLQREGAQLTIGRTRTAKLQIKDPSVSEKHAEAIWSDGQWHLRDVGSSNGTLLNGARLAAGGAPTPVKDGDTVCFGTVSVARLEIASTEDANLTVQQFLQTECQQLEQRVRNHAGQLGDDLRKAWVAQKQLLMSGE